MGYSLAAVVAYVGEAAGTAGAAAGAGGAAAEAGGGIAGAALGGAAAGGGGAGIAGSALAAGAGGAAAAGGILGTGIGLGTVSAGASLASTAYALTKGVPKLPTPGTITPTDNAGAITQASDAESLARQRLLAGGATSTMLTGGSGLSSPGTTTSKMLGGS